MSTTLLETFAVAIKICFLMKKVKQEQELKKQAAL